MVVLATGGMNLAIGSIGVCSVMLVGYLMQKLGLPVPLRFRRRVWFSARSSASPTGRRSFCSGVNSFIITLASASLFMGGMLILTKAAIYNGDSDGNRGFRTHALGLRVAAAPHCARDRRVRSWFSFASLRSAAKSWPPALTPAPPSFLACRSGG